MQCISSSNNNEQNTVDCVAPPSRIWLFASVAAAVERYGERNQNLLQKRRTTTPTTQCISRLRNLQWRFRLFMILFTPPNTTTHYSSCRPLRHESSISAFSQFGGWMVASLDGRPPSAVQQSIIDCIHILIKRGKIRSWSAHTSILDKNLIRIWKLIEIRKCTNSSNEILFGLDLVVQWNLYCGVIA